MIFMAICKSWNGKLGKRIREIMGMQGMRIGMRENRVEMLGMQGITVGMMKMWVIRVGMREIGIEYGGSWWECKE